MADTRRSSLRAAAALLAFAIIALALAPVSSPRPDGLAFTAQALGFDDKARLSGAPPLPAALEGWPARLAGAGLAACAAWAACANRRTMRKEPDRDGTLRNS